MARSCKGRDLDVDSQITQAIEGAVGDARLVAAIEEVAAEVAVGHAALEHEVDGAELWQRAPGAAGV
jgi:hypothetical protein